MATTTELPNNILRLEEDWPLERLVPYELNAKKHDPKQVAKIAASIKANGWTTRIIVEEDGTIIAGHGRRLASIELNLPTVPVLVLKGMTKEQARALRLIDNKVQEGGYDTDLLAQELRELHVDLDVDMGAWFDQRDLDFAIDDLGEIDLGSLTADISGEVIEQTEKTQAQIEDTDTQTSPVSKALGFNTVTGAQLRSIKRFIGAIEAETGLTGAEALCAFAREFEAA